MNTSNPWERWGIVHMTRDGFPALTEHAFWHLTAHHPATLERDGDTVYVHLDQPYRAVTVTSAYRLLVPAPGRPAPKHVAAPANQGGSDQASAG